MYFKKALVKSAFYKGGFTSKNGKTYPAVYVYQVESETVTDHGEVRYEMQDIEAPEQFGKVSEFIGRVVTFPVHLRIWDRVVNLSVPVGVKPSDCTVEKGQQKAPVAA